MPSIPAQSRSDPDPLESRGNAIERGAPDRGTPDPITTAPMPGAAAGTRGRTSQGGSVANTAEPRPAALGPDDLEACLALDQACLGGFWSRAQWCEELSQDRRPAMGLRCDGSLVAMACAWLVLDELHITLVAVDPAWRRRGLGRRVLLTLLQHGRALGAERATLEVAETNAAACRLYAGCGFATAGIRRGYYRNGDNALIQWLSLPPAAAASVD